MYYTTDGSDPRLEGGAVSASATTFTGSAPVVTTNTAPVIAKGDAWTYYDWGREPGADASGKTWRAAEYNAANLADDANAWLSGAAPLGFRSGVTFSTPLYRYVNHESSGTQVMTFYFRKTFTVPDGTDLASIVSVSGTAWYDDGFVMYINGVEVGRGNIGAGYAVTYATGSNETGTTHVDPADHAFTFAVPAGLIHAGENVVAVEVHQCHGTSSDAAWDLALGVDTATAGTGAGGLPVPADGLAIKARRLSQAGEWSALEDVRLVTDVPNDVALGVRVAAVYSSTADGGGDGAEFIVFTNLLDRAVSLEGLRFTCAKAGGDPSVDVTLGAGREIPANGTATFTKAGDWPSKKITNGAVDLMVYAPDGTVLQTLHVDANWWPVREYVNDKGKVKYVCACDGTGAHFVARDFGEDVTTEAQWKPSFLPPPTEAGENAIIAAVSADDRVRTWLDSIAMTAAGYASITNFSGEAAAVQAAYLVGLDTLADPQADLFFENISVGAGGRVTFDGDLKVQGARWRQKVNGTLRLYGYPELGGSPSVTDIPLEGGKFPLVGAEDTSGTNRFFKLVIE